MIENKPILSDGFVNWIDSNNFEDKIILELGSGYSTLFFSKKFKCVYSFENDAYWRSLIQTELDKSNIKNVNILELKNDIIANELFIELVKVADVFLIDNNPNILSREKLVYFIEANKKNKSIIILDNGEWHLDSYEFLRKNYYCLDFLRYDRKKLTQTSVFFHKRNSSLYEIDKLI